MRPLAGLRRAWRRRVTLFAAKRAARYHANWRMAMVFTDIFQPMILHEAMALRLMLFLRDRPGFG